ncbi:MAG: hypothetical protein EON54_05495 [Alcaligenaceae bacterium]|nr:MAG: hypothetical protein EON54_05495 [Alcaligenaceae bacterium]
MFVGVSTSPFFAINPIDIVQHAADRLSNAFNFLAIHRAFSRDLTFTTKSLFQLSAPRRILNWFTGNP